jgi:serine/threonine protein kinase
MATVYYGWDSSLERPVAIKVVNAQFRDNPAYAQRFVQEARTVATWRHNNILQVFYAGQEDALSYFVMEYVDGPDLGQVMRQYADDGELMPADDVLRLGKAIASALDYAHKQNVIHRDVKPANVMIAKDGRVVLADFGLALNTQQGSIGEIFGTPHYIAPEQARNSATAVPQSDLYALGVILYEMLTGVVPFDDPSPTSLAVQHITQPPPDPISINPRLNVETQDVLLKALSKMPADRYETGAALMAALEKALGSSKTAVSNTNLPPFPTGIVAPAMSQRSVAERVSFFLPPPPVAAPVPAPTSGGYRAAPSPIVPAAIPAAAPHTNSEVYVPKKQPWGLFAIGIIAILIVILFVGRALMGGTDELVESPTATSDVALVLPTVPTESSVVENALATVAPATASSAVETNSDPVPTATTIDEPVVVMETAVSIATEPAAPTVLYPNGHRLELLYNPTSLYLFNASSEQIRISTFFFEALNANGDPVGYSFDGYRWSQFYSYAASNGCVRLEVAKLSDYLRPAKCRAYNSTVNPPENDPQRFWIERPDVTQFRVSYQGEEIARCPIPGDYCEVYIP